MGDRYQSGFGNEFSTEALPGALPQGRNSPQRCPYGLYAEQFTGTAFTAPRAANRRSWLYRIRPAVVHGPFTRVVGHLGVAEGPEVPLSPNQLRWDPPSLPDSPTDFLQGLISLAGNGSPDAHVGCAIYVYAANESMHDRYFYDADGELLIVPQLGTLVLDTELGRLEVEPEEIAVIPRGLRFTVGLQDRQARGYVCENFGAQFRLPDLGPLGANGLANPRDFKTPVARYEDTQGDCELVAKFLGNLWSAPMDHSPLDVVAWHGNNAPYKYDLRSFNAMGTVSYDHPDPSIYLVLQSPTETAGTSNIDFVIFPPRWLVAENTFRPPWFHRNVASEFMGLIRGTYDAKAAGFLPGGASLHNCMSGHGPDADTFRAASSADVTRPQRLTDTMAFMFESRSVIRPQFPPAKNAPTLQNDYAVVWRTLERRFDPTRREF